MTEKRAGEEEKRLSSIGFLPFLAKWSHLGIAEASGPMGYAYNCHHLSHPVQILGLHNQKEGRSKITR